MELTLPGSLSRTLFLGAICSCLLFTSCSEDDPVKSYSNYRITVDAVSPVSFTALGEIKTIAVSASKEIYWDGKPSGEKEPAKVTASVEGEQFIVELIETEAGLQLKITAKENKTKQMQKGKVILAIEDDSVTEIQTLELNQDAATMEYGAYKITFEHEQASLDYNGGVGRVAFTCQREMIVNGNPKGKVPYSLNGVKYEACQFNDITYQIIKDGKETGKYMLEYNQPQAVSLHEVNNIFTLIEGSGKEEKELASFSILLAANPNGEDLWFVTEKLTGIYQGE